MTFEMWEISSTQVRNHALKVVFRLTKANKKPKGVLGVRTLTVTEEVMAVAIARASVTASTSWVTGFWRALSAYAALQANCVVKKGKLEATPGLIAELRDSSRTSWSGAVGQAVTWLVAINQFNCVDIVDFATACPMLSPQVPAPTLVDTRPDYLASDDVWQTTSVFESKGSTQIASTPVPWKGHLREALGQVDAGITRLKAAGHTAANIKRGVAVAFALKEGGPSLGGYADPKGEGDPERVPPETRLALMRLHYAYWAAAAGVWWLADLLARASVGRIPANIEDVGALTARVNTIALRPRRFPVSEDAVLVHAIDRDVLEAVILGDPMEIELARQRFAARHPRAEPDVFWFPDGTIYWAER